MDELIKIAELQGEIVLQKQWTEWAMSEMDFWRRKYLGEHPELDNWDYAMEARDEEEGHNYEGPRPI